VGRFAVLVSNLRTTSVLYWVDVSESSVVGLEKGPLNGRMCVFVAGYLSDFDSDVSYHDMSWC